jgi:uncharacterized cupredoxin-like copper-binding protein
MRGQERSDAELLASSRAEDFGELFDHGRTGTMRREFRALVALTAGMLVASACGGGQSDGGENRIEVAAYDDFRFDPAEVNVEAGQEITFVVTNEGQAAHEFLLGDEEEQMMAEGEGEHEGGHGGSEYEVLELDPGQTAEITVTFEDPGTILYGCHEPGHYDAGMVGTITVE